MKKLLSVAILLSLGLSGCAALLREHCTENAALDQGRQDRAEGREMDGDYALICPAGDRNFNNALNRAYRRGYSQGIRPQNTYYPNNNYRGGIGNGAYPNNGGGIGNGA